MINVLKKISDNETTTNFLSFCSFKCFNYNNLIVNLAEANNYAAILYVGTYKNSNLN